MSKLACSEAGDTNITRSNVCSVPFVMQLRNARLSYDKAASIAQDQKSNILSISQVSGSLTARHQMQRIIKAKNTKLYGFLALQITFVSAIEELRAVLLFGTDYDIQQPDKS
ncbi:MAG: hypothetical protein AB8B62_10140 [Roseobacter sp.]